ncbi:hypothetical protein CCH79_00010823, partial [Gambusia affinis]
MNYVLERVAPPQPGLPQPRFSLYLSSQLQYGIILVYHRQCTILLEELQSILGQLLKQRRSGKRDLSSQSKSAAVLPDALILMENTERAPDPLFGEMLLQDTMPSPTQLMQVPTDGKRAPSRCMSLRITEVLFCLLRQMNWETLRESSPELLEQSSSATSSSPHPENGISASPESITLSEPVAAPAPAIEFDEEDFTDYLPEIVALLLDQPDHFQEGLRKILFLSCSVSYQMLNGGAAALSTGGLEPRQEERRERARERARDRTRERARERTREKTKEMTPSIPE